MFELTHVLLVRRSKVSMVRGALEKLPNSGVAESARSEACELTIGSERNYPAMRILASSMRFLAAVESFRTQIWSIVRSDQIRGVRASGERLRGESDFGSDRGIGKVSVT